MRMQYVWRRQFEISFSFKSPSVGTFSRITAKWTGKKNKKQQWKQTNRSGKIKEYRKPPTIQTTENIVESSGERIHTVTHCDCYIISTELTCDMCTYNGGKISISVHHNIIQLVLGNKLIAPVASTLTTLTPPLFLLQCPEDRSLWSCCMSHWCQLSDVYTNTPNPHTHGRTFIPARPSHTPSLTGEIQDVSSLHTWNR